MELMRNERRWNGSRTFRVFSNNGCDPDANLRDEGEASRPSLQTENGVARRDDVAAR
jgi:hypothetical protein